MGNHIGYYQVLPDDVAHRLPNLNPQQNVGGTAADEDQNALIEVWEPAGDAKITGGGDIRPVLWYQVDLNDADDFRLRVFTRTPVGADKTISTFSFDGNTTRQFMDPFRLEWIRPDKSLFFF